MAGWNEWVSGANMTLSEVLDALKSATIGLDVKDKLFWSYYKIVELAIKEGNANFDVAKAAGSFKDLASRLDASDDKLTSATAQLVQKADQAFVDSQFASIVSGAPKGTYTNLGALQAAYPSGADGIFLTLDDGHWYYWQSTTSSWTDGGVYQGSEVNDGSISHAKLTSDFMDGGIKASGSINIDSFMEMGSYVLSAPISGTLPTGYDLTKAGFTIIIGSGQIRWQILSQYNVIQNKIWSRFLYQSGTKTEWELGFGALSMPDKSINRTKLTDNFRDGGTFSGNIDALIKEGSYLVLPPYTGTIPSGFTTETAFVIDVSVTGISWVTQKIRPLYGPIKQYERTLRGGPPTTELKEWKEIAYNLKKPRKLLFLGDSIPDSSDYPTLMGKQTGIAVTNGAIGGTTFSTHAQPAYDPFGGANLIKAIVTGDWSTQDANAGTVSAGKVNLLKQVDLSEYTDVALAYGTNDAYSITQLGAEDDTTVSNWSGAINYTLETLMTAYPHLRIWLISPIFRARNSVGDGQNSDDFERPIGGWLEDFVEIEIRQGKRHHVHVLDLYNNSGINKFNSEYYLSDGLHLTNKGKERLADVVGAFLIGN